jgi:hypothetical protein
MIAGPYLRGALYLPPTPGMSLNPLDQDKAGQTMISKALRSFQIGTGGPGAPAQK